MSTKFVKLIGKNWHNKHGTLNCIVIKLIGCAILSVKIIKEIISFEFSIFLSGWLLFFCFSCLCKSWEGKKKYRKKREKILLLVLKKVDKNNIFLVHMKINWNFNTIYWMSVILNKE